MWRHFQSIMHGNDAGVTGNINSRVKTVTHSEPADCQRGIYHDLWLAEATVRVAGLYEIDDVMLFADVEWVNVTGGHWYCFLNVMDNAWHHETVYINSPDSKVHGADMGLIWRRQDPGEPHVGPMLSGRLLCAAIGLTDSLGLFRRSL